MSFGNIKLLMMLGDSYISLGKEKKAEETYIRILEHDSQHVFTMKTLGMLIAGYLTVIFVVLRVNFLYIGNMEITSPLNEDTSVLRTLRYASLHVAMTLSSSYLC